ncbi:MAG: hypothetical protein QOK19_1947 [Solirubrobacteraceae bacterium]|jgi:uncharacterized protein (DUF427 family)|nr:uncharacterized protein [Solirubrobacterales bacterium]MEA2216386.1 hypothetical protein [Solirubrobacteraceae bacterium]
MSDATTEKPVKQPGPDHPITIEANPARVLVRVGDTIVADTRAALTLREASYPPVQYVPLEDVDSSLLTATDHATYCPYKGDASYYTIAVGEGGENAVWEYREPYAPVAEIKGHVAFYANRVQLTEEPAA